MDRILMRLNPLTYGVERCACCFIPRAQTVFTLSASLATLFCSVP